MSSFLPSSQANAGGSGTGTLPRSTVNNAAADALRKKMQQLRDELEQVKDDLERSRKELEKERHGREIVSEDFDGFMGCLTEIDLETSLGGIRRQSINTKIAFI